VNESEVLNGIT